MKIKKIFKWGTIYGILMSIYLFYPEQIVRMIAFFGMGILLGMDFASYLFIKYAIPRIKKGEGK